MKRKVKLGFCSYIRITYMFDNFCLYHCEEHGTKVVFRMVDGYPEYYMKLEVFQMINN